MVNGAILDMRETPPQERCRNHDECLAKSARGLISLLAFTGIFMNQGRTPKLLLLMSDLPYPVRKNGYSVRYYPIIEFLSESYDIHLVIISNLPTPEKDRKIMEGLCSRVSVWDRKPVKVSLLRKVATFVYCLLPGTCSYSAYRYDDRQLRRFVKTELMGAQYDVALCADSKYFELVKDFADAKRLVVDQIDSTYLHVLRLGTDSVFRWLEARKIKNRERRTLELADHTFYISPADLSIGSGRDKSDGKVSLVPNGVHINDVVDESISFGPKCIGYLGHMGYPPNIKAAHRLASIFEKVRSAEPEAKLVIIGRDPVKSVRDLEAIPGVIVTGTVDNIWSYLSGIDVFVFPMEIGSGQQNKVLEALYSKRPVITSAVGNAGIGAEAGKQVLIADTDSEFANEIIRLLSDENAREVLGLNGSEFVKSRYSWPAILTDIQRKLAS